MRYSRKNVLGNLYRGVIIVSAGFCLGSQFACNFFITSCSAHSLEISSTFCKMLSNESLHQMALKSGLKNWKRARIKEIEVKMFIFTGLLDNFWIMFNSWSCFTKWPFPQVSKEFFVRRLARGFHVVFHWLAAWPLWHTLLKRRQENS